MCDEINSDTKVTNHAKDRMKERLGINISAQQKMADKAYKFGIKHNETSGSLKRFLDREYLSHKEADNMRIYGDFLYLFCNKNLITVIVLPNKYKKVINKIKDSKFED